MFNNLSLYRTLSYVQGLPIKPCSLTEMSDVGCYSYFVCFFGKLRTFCGQQDEGKLHFEALQIFLGAHAGGSTSESVDSDAFVAKY